MTTEAKIGHGTRFQILDEEVSPAAWVTVAELVNVTPPSLARDTVDATHAASQEKWREFIPGLRDAGEVTLEMNFIPNGAGTTQIMGTFNRDTVGTYRIVFPDGDADASPPTATIWRFEAFCTGFAPQAPFDNKMSATATFKLSGKPAFLTSGGP